MKDEVAASGKETVCIMKQLIVTRNTGGHRRTVWFMEENLEY